MSATKYTHYIQVGVSVFFWVFPSIQQPRQLIKLPLIETKDENKKGEKGEWSTNKIGGRKLIRK